MLCGASSILSSIFYESNIRYELAALELNNIPLEAPTWVEVDNVQQRLGDRNHFQRQWELLQQITSRTVTVPLAAQLALVNAITKSFVGDYARSPLPGLLVNLLSLTSSEQNQGSLRHAIGISLTVYALANKDQKTARNAYIELSSRKSGHYDKKAEDRTPLMFGLFTLLEKYYETEAESNNEDQIKAIGAVLDTILEVKQGLREKDKAPGRGGHSRPPRLTKNPDDHTPTYKSISILRHGTDTDCDQQFQRIASGWLREIPQASAAQRSSAPPELYLEALLRPSLCNKFGNPELMTLLMDVFANRESLNNELRRVCILGYVNCASVHSTTPTEVAQRLMQINIPETLLLPTMSPSDKTAPYYMRFIWVTSIQLQSTIRSHAGDLNYESVLMHLLDRPTDPELPTNIGGILVENWIQNLVHMCDNDAQNLLDSGILGEMIGSNRETELRQVVPQSISLPGRFSNASTWLELLQMLEDDCENAVMRQAGKGGKEEAGPGKRLGKAPEGERATEQPS